MKFTPIAAENEADLVDEAERVRRRQGLPDEERHRPGQAAWPAARKTHAKDEATIAAHQRTGQADEEARAGGGFDRGEGTLATHQPPGARDSLRRRCSATSSRPSATASSTAGRPGRDLEADDRVRAAAAPPRRRRPPTRTEESDGPRPAEDSDFRARAGQPGRRAGGRPRRRRRAAARRSTRPRAATTAGSSSIRTTTRSLYCGDTNTTVSRDGGKTFQMTGWDGNGKTHVDHRVVWVDPLNSQAHPERQRRRRVRERWDGGQHWSQKNGINAQQFYDVSVDNELPYNIMGGTQDNGAWLGPSQNRNSYGMFANDWTYLPTGDGSTSSATGGTPSTSTTRASSARPAGMNLKTGETSQLAVAPDASAGHGRRAGAALPVERADRALAAQPGHRLHRVAVRVAVAEPRRHRLVRADQPGSHQGRQGEAGRGPQDQPAVGHGVQRSPNRRRSRASTGPAPTMATCRCRPDCGATWTNITDQFYDATGKPKAQGESQGRPHSLRPLGEAGGAVGVRREHRATSPSAATGRTTRTRPGCSSPRTSARRGRTSRAA